MIYNYFIGHRPFELPAAIEGIKLQVGNQSDFGDVRDNTGDQIADKNANYCELTALYWIWKNECPKMNSDDRISINHYRRWFVGLNDPSLENVLKNDQAIVLPKFEPYRETVKEQYCNESGFLEDLNKVRSIIQRKYPEDVVYFDQVMEQGGIHQYNMMITTVNHYSDFCSWLFPILFDLEKEINLDNYNDYQKRIYGFLSERLLNVWVKSRRLTVAEMKVEQPQIRGKDMMRLNLRRVRNRIEFKLFHKKRP